MIGAVVYLKRLQSIIKVITTGFIINMADYNETQNAIFEILEAFSTIDLNIFDKKEGKNELVERGLPNGDFSRRSEIQNRLISNQKRKSFIQKIEAIKDIIQQRDEEKGIMILASLINEMLNPMQVTIFMNELYGANQRMQNIEYYGFPEQYPQFTKYNLVSRSCEPHNSILQGDVLDSLNIREEESQLKLPIEVKYNPSEAYLIYKGINNCRMLLKNFNDNKDNTIIRDLKSKDLLNIVLTEQIGNDKNYIAMLVDSFPRSLEEIKFILIEDQDLLLKSSLFANMAVKNVRNLYQLLVDLSNTIDKNILSRACDQSEFNGITVVSALKQNFPPDMKIFVEKISRFLNRYKQGASY